MREVEKVFKALESSAGSAPAGPSTAGQKRTDGAAVSPPIRKTHSPAELAALEQRMIDLINQERTKAGLKSLEVDPRVTKLARMKSQDMVDKGYLDHKSPTYGYVEDMVRAAGISAQAVGENVGTGRTVEGLHETAMESPTHRRNILSPQYTHIGVGIVDGQSGIVTTEMFIGK